MKEYPGVKKYPGVKVFVTNFWWKYGADQGTSPPLLDIHKHGEFFMCSLFVFVFVFVVVIVIVFVFVYVSVFVFGKGNPICLMVYIDIMLYRASKPFIHDYFLHGSFLLSLSLCVSYLCICHRLLC